MSGRKRLACCTGKVGAVSAELCEQVKRNRKKSVASRSPQIPQWCSIRVAPATVRAGWLWECARRLWLECVTATRWKLPMTEGTVLGDYCRGPWTLPELNSSQAALPVQAFR